MKARKIFAVLVAVVLFLTALVGCATKPAPATTSAPDTSNETAAPADTPKEVITFTCYYGDTTAPPVDFFNTPIGKKITELTGYKLTIEYIVGSDEQTKAGVMIASGDYPDFINGHEVHRQFLDAGALIPIEDLIDEYGVNVKKTYDEKRLKQLKMSDGHIYFLSAYKDWSERVMSPSGTWLQKAVLKDAGYPVVNDFDQYCEIIKNYVQKNPTINGQPTIGFTQCTDSWRFFSINTAPSRVAGYPNDATALVDPETYKVFYFDTLDMSKRYYAKLNEMWNQGLVDPELFAQNYDAYIAKIASGRVVGFWEPYWQIQPAEQSLKDQGMLERMHVAVPATFDGVRDQYNIPGYMVVRDGMSISVDCKDPVDAFKYLDSMLSDEVLTLSLWGIEGVDFMNDGGKYYRTAEQWQNALNADYQKKQGLALPSYSGSAPQFYKLANGNFADPLDTQEYIDMAYDDSDREVLAAYGVKAYPEMLAPPVFNPWHELWDIQFSQDEIPADVQDANTQIGDLRREYVPKLVMAAPGTYEAIWAEYVAKYTPLAEIRDKVMIPKYEEAVQFRVTNWN